MNILEPLRHAPKRVMLPALGVSFLIAAAGLISLGIGPSFLGQATGAPGSRASAQSGSGSSVDGANVYTIADFVNRSPGERGEVTGFKKGIVRSAVASLGRSPGAAPTQRALGKIFEQETPGIADVRGASLAALPVTGLDGVPLVPQGGAPGPLFGGGAPIFAAAPGAVIIPFPGGPPSGGGGGGGGDGGGGGIIDGPITLPPAVPEPGTWAMIIMGLFGIGLAMRRANKARAMSWNQSAS